MRARWTYARAPPRPDEASDAARGVVRSNVLMRGGSAEAGARAMGETVVSAASTRAEVGARAETDGKRKKNASAPAAKRAKKSSKPSVEAEAIALAFEPGRGEAMEGLDVDGCDDADEFDRAFASIEDGSTCAMGVLRRDVVRVVDGQVEIWFGFSSNLRAADAGEIKAARKAAKKFGGFDSGGGEDEDEGAGGVHTEVLGFGIVFATTEEFFFLKKEDSGTPARLEALMKRLCVATYCAADVVQCAMDVGARSIDPSTANFMDCRVDAWLMNPDRAFDGGVSDIPSAYGDVARPTSSWSDSPAACFRGDLASTLWYCQRASDSLKLRSIPQARRVETKIAVILGVLQHRGIAFDRGAADEQRQAANARVEELQRRTKDTLGEEINLASAQQVSEILYNKLNLPPPSAHAMKGAKSSHLSTSVEVLQALVEKHVFAQIVLDHRGALKERAMCDGYDKAAVGSPPRVHAQWNNTSTNTGRLSASKPNVQQVGRGSMRQLFIAPSGRVLIAGDYNQIELRVLAHLSEDERLISLLRTAKDVFVAIWNAGKNLPADTPTEPGTRDIAKRTTYGILFGQHAMGLAEKLNCSKAEAQGYIAAFHRAFPRVQTWISRVLQLAEENGAVTLPISGRHRSLQKIHSNVFSERSEAQRQAVNTVIQGTASDLIKTAMLRWCSATGAGRFAKDIEPGSVDDSRVSLVAQIHDELLFECDEDYVPDAVTAIRVCMEGAIEMSVPTPVKISVGKSWGALAETTSSQTCDS